MLDAAGCYASQLTAGEIAELAARVGKEERVKYVRKLTVSQRTAKEIGLW
jgi:hypothetical protein